MNKTYTNFIKTAKNDVERPLYKKIGMQYKIIRGFVLFLSLVSILAGFSFFYTPVNDISGNAVIAFLIALLIVTIIEIASLLSFEHAIFEINRGGIGGYFLLLFALSILAVNVYTHAEGNKELIRKLATKPQALENNLNDTMTIIDFEFDAKMANLKNDYSNRKDAINREYTAKLQSIETDIQNSFDADGVLLDWRKNHEATKNKALIIQNWEAEKTALTKNELFEIERLKQNTDSIKNRLYAKQTKHIETVTVQADNSAKVAYIFGFVLVFLIISIRLIALLSKIAAANKHKNHKQVAYKVIVEDVDEDIDFDALNNKTPVPLEIVDNREVLAEKKPVNGTILHFGNGNNNKH